MKRTFTTTKGNRIDKYVIIFKFDIFLKRFMKVEEDIKEIKNNFFRVMHCAFAKYEEGFKRKLLHHETQRSQRPTTYYPFTPTQKVRHDSRKWKSLYDDFIEKPQLTNNIFLKPLINKKIP